MTKDRKDNFEALSKEQLKKQMQELKEKMQNDFIDSLHEKVSYYNEKVNKKDYKLTLHEQKQVAQIYSMIKWIYQNA